MNKVQLVEAVQKQLGKEISKAQAERTVTAVIDAIKIGVKENKAVQLIGFGTFKVVQRKARKGINNSVSRGNKVQCSTNSSVPQKSLHGDLSCVAYFFSRWRLKVERVDHPKTPFLIQRRSQLLCGW